MLLFFYLKGLVVSIASCFIHGEVRVEIVLMTCEILKKIKCLRSLKCIESDYVNQLRYSQAENRFTTSSNVKFKHSQANRSKSYNLYDRQIHTNHQKNSTQNQESLKISTIDEDEKFKQVTFDKRLTKKKLKLSKAKSLTQTETITDSTVEDSELRKLSVEISMASNPVSNKCCNFLFTNQRNDFFADNRRSKRRSKKGLVDSLNNQISKEMVTSKDTCEIKNLLEETEIRKFCAKCNQLVKINMKNSELNSLCECGCE